MQDQHTKDNIHSGHRERMREKFIANSDTLFPHEILEIILYGANKRKNTNGIAHALLDKFGSLTAVLDASVEELMQVDGVGKQSAVMLKTYTAAFRRYQTDKLAKKKKIFSFGDAVNFCMQLLKDSPKEECVAIFLDGKGTILKTKKWDGTINRVKVTSREVIEYCATTKAVGVLLAHSHPNGMLSPSNADLLFTKTLYVMLRSMDAKLMDHFIVDDERYFSFSRSDYFTEYERKFREEYNPLALSQDTSFLDEIFKKDI